MKDADKFEHGKIHAFQYQENRGSTRVGLSDPYNVFILERVRLPLGRLKRPVGGGGKHC